MTPAFVGLKSPIPIMKARLSSLASRYEPATYAALRIVSGLLFALTLGLTDSVQPVDARTCSDDCPSCHHGGAEVIVLLFR